MEGHWPPPTRDKQWRTGIWKNCVCVPFANDGFDCLMTHCAALCKQTVGNVFFVVQKRTPLAALNHANKSKNIIIFVKNDARCVGG